MKLKKFLNKWYSPAHVRVWIITAATRSVVFVKCTSKLEFIRVTRIFPHSALTQMYQTGRFASDMQERRYFNSVNASYVEFAKLSANTFNLQVNVYRVFFFSKSGAGYDKLQWTVASFQNNGAVHPAQSMERRRAALVVPSVSELSQLNKVNGKPLSVRSWRIMDRSQGWENMLENC